MILKYKMCIRIECDFCFFFFLKRKYDLFFFFFFQAEDGIRDPLVTGVQTCALPIWQPTSSPSWSEDLLRHVFGGGSACLGAGSRIGWDIGHGAPIAGAVRPSSA